MIPAGKKSRILIALGLVGLAALVLGLWLFSPTFFGGCVIVLCIMALSIRGVRTHLVSKLWLNRANPNNITSAKRSEEARSAAHAYPQIIRKYANETENLVEDFLNNGRAALLLRPQTIGNLDADQLRRATAHLDNMMCLVPTGPILLHYNGDSFEENERLWKVDGQAAPNNVVTSGHLVRINSLFLDRFAVTNADFQKFVDHGGYEQLAIWDEETLPALMDFVDKTGYPGPRFWRNGKYREHEGNLPVVGVSWFEARAFARWCGKRLPTDAEWSKAGAWPVESSPGCLTQRRFPWGNSFDASRTNIWGSGPERIVAVDHYNEGISIGGAYQLVGNVWEWLADPFGDPDDTTLRLPTPMKSIRGGAYDTYFDNQASCHFQSGESPLARRHNIGFRLAISVHDLAPEATGLHDASFEQLVDENPSETSDEDASLVALEEVI